MAGLLPLCHSKLNRFSYDHFGGLSFFLLKVIGYVCLAVRRDPFPPPLLADLSCVGNQVIWWMTKHCNSQLLATCIDNKVQLQAIQTVRNSLSVLLDLAFQEQTDALDTKGHYSPVMANCLSQTRQIICDFEWVPDLKESVSNYRLCNDGSSLPSAALFLYTHTCSIEGLYFYRRYDQNLFWFVSADSTSKVSSPYDFGCKGKKGWMFSPC